VNELELAPGAHALFTERADGNLSSVGGDEREYAAGARNRLKQRIGVHALVRGYQEHGVTVARVRSLGEPEVRADGQATALRAVGTMVLTADCVPVALASDGAVAAVHAGWRGLSAGVLESGVLTLRELGGEAPIVAVVGPCAGACCYEVGEEVHAAFAGAHRRGDNLDLRAIAHDRLLAAGVEQVRDVHACTICDERFFSHRREGERAGRQAVVVWLS
jgi:polyphenol oxidase